MDLPRNVSVSLMDMLEIYSDLNNFPLNKILKIATMEDLEILKNKVAVIINKELQVSVFSGDMFPFKINVEHIKKILESSRV